MLYYYLKQNSKMTDTSYNQIIFYYVLIAIAFISTCLFGMAFYQSHTDDCCCFECQKLMRQRQLRKSNSFNIHSKNCTCANCLWKYQ